MKMSSILSLGLAAVFAGALAHRAVGDIMYSYVSDQGNYSAAPNGTVNVRIYLDEQLTGSSVSLITSDGGLGNAGFQVNQTGTPPSGPALLDAVTAAAGFDGTSAYFTQTSTEVAFTEGIGLTAPGVPVTSVTAGLNQVFLGTLTVTAGSVAGQTTQFTIGPITANHGNTLTLNNIYDLDQTNNGGNPGASNNLPATYTGATGTPFTVTTTAVPEPAALALMLLGGLGLLVRRRVRKVI